MLISLLLYYFSYVLYIVYVAYCAIAQYEYEPVQYTSTQCYCITVQQKQHRTPHTIITVSQIHPPAVPHRKIFPTPQTIHGSRIPECRLDWVPFPVHGAGWFPKQPLNSSICVFLCCRRRRSMVAPSSRRPISIISSTVQTMTFQGNVEDMMQTLNDGDGGCQTSKGIHCTKQTAITSGALYRSTVVVPVQFLVLQM